jgi:endoglucanase Acf2
MKRGILSFLILLVAQHVSSQVLVNPGGAACLARYTTTYPGAAQPFNTDWELPGSTDIVDKTQQAPKVVAGFTQPVQTNDWWSSAIWDYYQGEYNRAFTGNLFALPWTARAIRGGLQLQYKNLATNTNNADNYIFQSATNEISVSLSKGAGTPQAGTATNMNVPGGAGQGTQVKNYGDYHVTLTWNDAANSMSMDATIIKGNPFVFFDNISASTDVVIRTACGPMILGYTSPSGNRRVTICGRNYGIFFSPGTTIVNNPVGGTMWQLNEGHAAGDNVNREFFRFTPPAAAGQRYVILAALPNNTDATFLEYERRAYAFVTNTESSYSYNEATGDVTTVFTTTTALKANAPAAIVPLNQTIHALFRHQFLNIDPLTPVNTPYQYESPRGNMQVRFGNFNTVMKHYGMLQHLPWYGSYNNAQLYNLVNQKYLQVPAGTGLVQPTTDLYFWGKRMGEIAQLLPIARMVGHWPAYNRFRTELRVFLANLFTTTAGETTGVFYYDDTWDMLLYYPGSFWSTDQGNDRHFHYGYIIQASAMLARYDPTFITEYGPMVEMLIKDIANWQRQAGGSGVNIFPYLRYFDVYEGHSWANGMAADGENNGNDQESASESINFASSVALWGEVTGNNTLRDLGIYLRTTEIAAWEQYWMDVDNVVYPAGYAHQTSGIVYGGGANYQIFFGGNMRQGIHGINWVPLTGSSFFISMPQPAGSNPVNKFNEMLSKQIPPATPGAIYYHEQHFPDIMISFRALYDPVTAKTEYANLPANMNGVSPGCCPWALNGQNHPYDYYDGQFTAFTNHWVHTLDSLRNVQRIWSNYSKTHVFYNTCWHYVIDNDESFPINVTFSDGRVINNIPGDTVIVYRFCSPPMPVQFLSLETRRIEEGALLHWITSSEKDNDHFIVERSRDGVHFEIIGKVNGKGDSNTETHYYFTDSDPYPGISYYRIRQVDRDGKYSFSDVVKLSSEGGLDIVQIYPNPVESDLTIVIASETEKELEIKIIDIPGREAGKSICKVKSGHTEIKIDCSYLPSGLYLIQIRDEFSGVMDRKFVKR